MANMHERLPDFKQKLRDIREKIPSKDLENFEEFTRLRLVYKNYLNLTNRDRFSRDGSFITLGIFPAVFLTTSLLFFRKWWRGDVRSADKSNLPDIPDSFKNAFEDPK